jgi:hypothetical protein
MSAPTLKRTTDAADVREYIRAVIVLKFGTMTAYAKKEAVSLPYLSNVLAGHKPIPEWMYRRFKIVHTVKEHWALAAEKEAA